MRQFGLIGKALSYSFSKEYFSNKFSKEHILNAKYSNFSIDSIKGFKSILSANPNLKGLNVTIPYKEEVIPLLDKLDDEAQAIGAVNTIKFNANGESYGFNTDAIGFRNSIKPFLAKEHSRALIFGTGGSSKAVRYVLNQLQIPYYQVSRNPQGEKVISYDDLDQSSIQSFKLLINCTPLGTFPEVKGIIPIDLDGISSEHLVYDLIYNPEETKLLKEAKLRGALTVNGLSMLRIQAEESWEIWNG